MQTIAIKIKELEIGTFKTTETDSLTIYQHFLKFTFKGEFADQQVELKKTDITSIEHFDEDDNFVRIKLRPAKAKEISEKVPRGCFTFYSTDKSSDFKLHFFQGSEVKEFLSEFYCKTEETNTAESEEKKLDERKETDEAPQSAEGWSEDLDIEAGITTDGSPIKKKAKTVKSEADLPTRTLRSKTQPKLQKQIDASDFLLDDDSIPDELKKFIDENPIRNPSPSPFDRFENATELLKYHTAAGSEIIIRMEDYKCLDRRELISDVVIDFYLAYIYKEVFPDELKARVHIYTTHFYRYLATKSNYAGWNDKEIKTLTAAEKRYERVRYFPCNQEVNIFEKDFVVFPCINNEHWFLAIVCFPGLNGACNAETGELISPEEATKNPEDPTGSPAKVSSILVFDSVKANFGRKLAAITHIRNFLLWEHKIKYQDQFEFDHEKMRGMSPKCPQQSNATDCGLFVLQFFEHFFLNSPIVDFRFPVDTSDWFDPKIIFEKREHIANVIRTIMASNDELPELPDISFYNDVTDAEIAEDEQAFHSNGNDNDNNNAEEFNNNNDFNTADNNEMARVNDMHNLNSEDPPTMVSGDNVQRAIVKNGFHNKFELESVDVPSEDDESPHMCNENNNHEIVAGKQDNEDSEDLIEEPVIVLDSD